ncbi:RloB family protein [Streptomyces sp. NBC_00654]|uniref:RloB family protein n=1 Tax=Streptomyces sp. NBC_00654 TaxID=2975799 RepID=UPI002252C718|nr:RloB family protein [Streptomyces sp. NBC_00654]MCX4964960.1 RloB family protein [Streptomyces sp. NBC_00654]
MSTRGGQQVQHDHQGQTDEQPRRKRKSRKGEEKPLVAPAPPLPADTRAQRVLYVGCEGESTEPDYLNYLNERFGDGSVTGGRRFRIQPVYAKNGLTPARVVAQVQAKAEEDEAWALFDRDQHHDIPEALDLAAEQGTEVCFSHPSFDLWLLLHFQAFGGRRSGSSEHVVETLRQADPAFKNFDKRNDKSVKDGRRAALTKKESAAVSHARGLVAQCEHGACKAKSTRKDRHQWEGAPERPDPLIPHSGHADDCPVLDRDPSTDVWRLLVSLEIVDA